MTDERECVPIIILIAAWRFLFPPNIEQTGEVKRLRDIPNSKKIMVETPLTGAVRLFIPEEGARIERQVICDGVLDLSSERLIRIGVNDVLPTIENEEGETEWAARNVGCAQASLEIWCILRTQRARESPLVFTERSLDSKMSLKDTGIEP